ncbi:MAG: prepilin-type N-terminal cleavage/methylation domain-containing protein [candidate division NC10 bacterium]|nr:prepilin-type N-terminal cleavage/methylation domain-containing protein [candidate division NC10 bacterium]
MSVLRTHRVPASRGGVRDAAQGFTIIETMIAASIMVVALLAIAAVLPTADMSLHQSGQISKAISLAQEMIEMIKNDPFTDLPAYNGVDTRTTGTYPTDFPIPPVPGAPGNFMGGSNITKWANDINLYLVTGSGITSGFGTIAVTTVASDTGGNPILRKVTVTVNWTDSGRPYLVRLATLASAI